MLLSKIAPLLLCAPLLLACDVGDPMSPDDLEQADFEAEDYVPSDVTDDELTVQSKSTSYVFADLEHWGNRDYTSFSGYVDTRDKIHRVSVYSYIKTCTGNCLFGLDNNLGSVLAYQGGGSVKTIARGSNRCSSPAKSGTLGGYACTAESPLTRSSSAKDGQLCWARTSIYRYSSSDKLIDRRVFDGPAGPCPN